MSTALQRVPPEEYLLAEHLSETKHEFYDGEVFAMSGASFAHNRIALNLYGEARSALKGKECAALPSEMRVKCPSGLYTYPDSSIVCGKPEIEKYEGIETLLNPRVVIEILSPSTEKYDRGKKFELYRSIESLREYILIAQDEVAIESFRLDVESGNWIWNDVREVESMLVIPSVGIELPVSELYAGVDFPEPKTPLAAKS